MSVVIQATGPTQLRTYQFPDANTKVVTQVDPALLFGTGGVTYLPSGVIYRNLTPVSNVGTGVTDLMSYSLLGNSLSVDGMGIRVFAWGINAANGFTKTKVLVVGGVALTQRISTANGTTWDFEAVIYRTGASAESYWAANEDSNSGKAQTALTLALDTTLPIIIKMTGQSGTQSNDLTQLGMMIEALP